MKNTQYDLVIMGATGFTGILVVEYLIKNYGVSNDEFTWAIAGRKRERLENLRTFFQDIDSDYDNIPILVVDSMDSLSLDAMTSICRLVVSTVGPYLKYGKLLIESCVKNSTHYCDLTGEVPFIRESIDLFDRKAQENNCRIIHSCGFDSIPSDIGVLLLQTNSLARFNKPCNDVNLYVQSMRGGLSGGTIESIINISRYIDANPKHKSILRVIDRRYESNECFIRYDDSPDEDWLMLIYLEDSDAKKGKIVVENKANPEKHETRSFDTKEIFTYSDYLVDAMTSHIDRERQKKSS